MFRMNASALCFLIVVLVATSFIACKKNDDEPILPPTRISRLYVSFSEIQADDLAQPYQNIGVFDPADSLMLSTPTLFDSKVREGAGIYYNPYAKRVFQGSLQDFSIKTFSVSLVGVLGAASSFIDSTLTSQPDLAYDAVSTNLYVTNSLGNSIHVYDRGASRNGVLPNGPNKRFELGGQPRGLVLDNDSIMVVLRTGTINEVALLENPSQIDSGAVVNMNKITVSGASDLRGIAYSQKLNLLIVSDVANGKVYMIDNAREAFTQNLEVTTEQSIGGALTEMSQPIDVAIDDRDEKSFLYVADREKKMILRFSLSDRGNVAPQTTYKTQLTPVSIHLDAR